MPATTSRASERPIQQVRKKKPALVVGVVLVGLVVLAGAVLLIVRGARSTPPPPAPSPSREYAVTAPLGALLPDDEIPDRQAGVGPVASIDPGDQSQPPVHVGQWTYAGSDRLFIRSLDVEAPIEPVGTENGAMIIPSDVQRVGRWDRGAALDGDSGTVLIVGHVNFASQGPGALYNLYRVEPGAVIVTTDGAGRRASWRVTGLESVDKKALPPEIFDATGPRRLALVTCGGELLHVDGPDGGFNTYENNIVVHAVPA